MTPEIGNCSGRMPRKESSPLSSSWPDVISAWFTRSLCASSRGHPLGAGCRATGFRRTGAAGALGGSSTGARGLAVLHGSIYGHRRSAGRDAPAGARTKRSSCMRRVPKTCRVGAERLRPLLDAAIAELRESDRDAVILRFFKNRSWADVEAHLRLTENGARMRVERALAKLQVRLSRRGVRSSAAAVAGCLPAQPIVAAPSDSSVASAEQLSARAVQSRGPAIVLWA